MVATYIMLHSIGNSKRQVYNLFLQIPSSYLKILHEVSEQFVMSLQYDQDTERAGRSGSIPEEGESEARLNDERAFVQCILLCASR
ncbi:MAG: hypothetical protein P4M11_11145 [Candidatus Pacebacteria bacterium]|nr:hypothetical protein [Candidatus Paceibacterota bacterium]